MSADKAVSAFIRAGVHPSKLILGMPLYGRAFVDTKGIGNSFISVGNGSWEKGVWDYKELPLDGARETVDQKAVSAYSYNRDNRTLVTYDNAETARMKAHYVLSKQLGGGMWWESSGDLPISNPRSLIAAFSNELGVNNLDTSRPNVILPPMSSKQANASNSTASHEQAETTGPDRLAHQLQKTYF